MAGTLRGVQPGGAASYAAPSLTVHGTLADLTMAALIGPFVDSNHAQGELIINNTSA